MLLVDALLDVCARFPDRPAVIEGDVGYTFAQLDERSDRIATGLIERGVTAGDVVGLLAPRGWDRCAALLGIWRAGGAVNALDPYLPLPRLGQLVRSSGATMIVRVPGTATVDLGVPDIDLAEVTGHRSGAHLTGPIAYTIGTSGSTGVPKCVAVPPVVLAKLATWHVEHWTDARIPRTAHTASVGFDVNVQELTATWYAGAPLIVFDDRQRQDPFILAEALERSDVARIFVTVTSLHMLAIAAATTGRGLPSVREVVVTGERLVINDDVRALFADGHMLLVNHYGPSETHVITEHRLDRDPATWPVHPPLGIAIVGAELVREVDGRLVPFAEGDEDELLIAGSSMAVGYLGDDALTAVKFCEVPHLDGDVRRVYRSGDAVRLRDGLFHFVGRVDDQLKIRGYRIEPGDIEAVLARVPGVRRAAVVGKRLGASTTLQAYVVLDARSGIDAKVLRVACENALPDYMVPSRFLEVTDLPVTASGKVSRRELDGVGAVIG